MDCNPYGKVRTCTATSLSQLSTLIASCQRYIPKMSAQLLLTVSNMNYMGQHFAALSTELDDQFYANHLLRIKQLLALGNELAALPALQSTFDICLESHNTVPSDRVVLGTFHNLRHLREKVIHLRNFTETTFYEVLDRDPVWTEVKLRSMVREVSAIASSMARQLTFHTLHRYALIKNS